MKPHKTPVEANPHTLATEPAHDRDRKPDDHRGLAGLELKEPTWKRCQGACNQSWTRLEEFRGLRLCEDCLRRARAESQAYEEGRQILAGKAAIIHQRLKAAGYSPRELTARADKIPTELAELAAGADLLALLEGTAPAHGWGYSGPPGTGKTCAIAAWIKAGLENRITTLARQVGAGVLEPWVRWVVWPEFTAWARWRSQQVEGYDDVHGEVMALSEIPLLVLDDLGAERARGDYNEDYATAQLEHIILRRYRECLPTWYTTNLPAAELVYRYGAHAYSRLCTENPIYEIKATEDLRLGRVEPGVRPATAIKLGLEDHPIERGK